MPRPRPPFTCPRCSAVSHGCPDCTLGCAASRAGIQSLSPCTSTPPPSRAAASSIRYDRRHPRAIPSPRPALSTPHARQPLPPTRPSKLSLISRRYRHFCRRRRTPPLLPTAGDPLPAVRLKLRISVTPHRRQPTCAHAATSYARATNVTAISTMAATVCHTTVAGQKLARCSPRDPIAPINDNHPHSTAHLADGWIATVVPRRRRTETLLYQHRVPNIHLTTITTQARHLHTTTRHKIVHRAAATVPVNHFSRRHPQNHN